MKQMSWKKSSFIIVILFVFVLIKTSANGHAARLDVDIPSNLANEDEIVFPGTTSTTVFIPMVYKNYPWISPFGIEL